LPTPDFALAIFAVHRASSYRQLAYPLAGLVLLLAGALHGVSEWLPPTEMDFISVRMTSGDTTDGYYLAGDGSTIYIAPNVGKRSIGVITALPRSDISSIDLRREDTLIRPLGTELPKALIGRFASPAQLPPQRKARRDELLVYAAGIRSDVGWRFRQSCQLPRSSTFSIITSCSLQARFTRVRRPKTAFP
jgi:hypothetical protein